MKKIKKIALDDKVIKMDLEDYELSVPLNKDYVKENIDKALSETKIYLRDFKFYKFSSRVCKLVIILSAGLYLGCFLSDFILLEFMNMLCGGLGCFSLMGYGLSKLFEKKALEKAYNNDYWLAIKDAAFNNITNNNEKKKVSSKKEVKENTDVKVNNFHNNLPEEKEFTKVYKKI